MGAGTSSFYKGKGERRSCASSRSARLANGVGKHYHCILRGRRLPYLERYAPEVTCALRGRGVDAGPHVSRLAQEWAAGTGQRSAVIFCCITAAYRAALRELAVGGC